MSVRPAPGNIKAPLILKNQFLAVTFISYYMETSTKEYNLIQKIMMASLRN